MIVELVGLPGAGKTTFAKRLVAEGFVRVDIADKAEIIALNLLFALRYPVTFLCTLFALLRHLGRPSRWTLKIASLFLAHNAKYMKAGRYARAVIDQGHHQNVVALFDDSISERELHRYVALLPKPDVLVLFDVPKAEREARMEKRGYCVRGWEDREARDRWLSAAERHYAALLRLRLSNALPFPSLVVGGGDHDDHSEKLANKREDGFFDAMRSHFSEDVADAGHTSRASVTPAKNGDAGREKDAARIVQLLKKRVWYYVMNARMPTEKAHGFQIAKSCEALRRIGELVVLLIPRRAGSAPAQIASYYALRDSPAVRMLRTPTYGWVVFSDLRFILQSLSFLVALFFARIDREGIYYTRSAEIVWLLKLRGAGRVVYEAHVFPASKKGLFISLVRRADLVVANSGGTAAAYRAAGLSRVLVAPNGVDLALFFTDEGRENARNRIGLPSAKHIVLYSGSFYRWKGVPLLLEGWRRNLAQRSDLLLVLVGGTMAHLAGEGAAADAATIPNLLIVPHQPSGSIVSYLRAADVLVLPTAPVSEEAIIFTSPIKLFEYMASGRPSIAADLPSIREIASEKEALFARAGDPDDLAAKIVDLLGDPALGESLAASAREKVQDFDWENRARKITAEINP